MKILTTIMFWSLVHAYDTKVPCYPSCHIMFWKESLTRDPNYLEDPYITISLLRE